MGNPRCCFYGALKGIATIANFPGHITAGSIGAVTVGCTAFFGLALPWETSLNCAAAFAIGSILPDIDSDGSHSIRIIFNFFFGIILVVSTHMGYTYPGILAAVIFRYGFIWVFRRMTVHRGIWHSIPMGVLCALAVHSIFDSIYYAGALLCGFLTHLIVDEVCAIGKVSQWTAMKFWAKRYSGYYFMIYMGCGLIVFFKMYTL